MEGRGDGTEGWTKKEGVRGWRDGEQTLDLDPTQRGTHGRPSGPSFVLLRTKDGSKNIRSPLFQTRNIAMLFENNKENK